MNSRIIIGDVHGCYATLLALIAKLPKDVPITFVGDLVDRGPHSRDVVAYVIEKGHDCVKGNHEDMMVASTTDLDSRANWLYNGGDNTLDSYLAHPLEIGMHVQWMEKLPAFIEYPDIKNSEGRYLVVSHAGLGRMWSYRDCPDRKHAFVSECMWNRDHYEDVKEIYNIYGHTPQIDPRVKSFYANVDTGACFKNRAVYGKLTAIQYPELTIYEQENIE